MIACILGWLLDAGFGETRRWHPLVGFGELALRIEPWANRRVNAGPWLQRVRGAGCTLALVGTAVTGVLSLRALVATCVPDAWSWILDSVVLYFCLGHRSLREHARAVSEPLCAQDLERAKAELAKIVSRDTEPMGPSQIADGVIESVLENGSDAVIASLLWFLVAGVPGVVAHRCINTLDAMWGYKTERYLYFGWAAARLDDLANWAPARVCALGYALAGRTGPAIYAWCSQGASHKSPNAGAVMASGAGALGIEIGGPARYQGVWESKQRLGQGRCAAPSDIERAIDLLSRCVWFFMLAGGVLWGLGFLPGV